MINEMQNLMDISLQKVNFNIIYGHVNEQSGLDIKQLVESYTQGKGRYLDQYNGTIR